jgi:hypothetical protein
MEGYFNCDGTVIGIIALSYVPSEMYPKIYSTRHCIVRTTSSKIFKKYLVIKDIVRFYNNYKDASECTHNINRINMSECSSSTDKEKYIVDKYESGEKLKDLIPSIFCGSEMISAKEAYDNSNQSNLEKIIKKINTRCTVDGEYYLDLNSYLEEPVEKKLVSLGYEIQNREKGSRIYWLNPKDVEPSPPMFIP